MFATPARVLGRVLSLSAVLVLGAAPAGFALDSLEFRAPGANKALEKTLRGASILLQSQREKNTEAQDLFADARAEYASLLNALYANGYYSGVIHVLIDGREAAAIAPLDAPARISRIEVLVEPGPLFAFSQASIKPLPPKTELPSDFSVGKTAESGVVLDAVAVGVDAWRGKGHAKARVGGQSVIADHSNATLSADVTLAPGPKLRFGRLKVEGQQRMREARIRAITGLPEGEVYDPEEIARAKDRLRRTGVFKSVTLAEDENITSPDLLGTTLTVAEEKRRRYTFGAEVATADGLKLTGEWIHRNLFGGAERLTIGGEIRNIGSAESGTDYLLHMKLDRPATFTADTTLSFATSLGHFDEQDFTADTFTVSSTLTRVFSDELTATAGLSYGWGRVEDISGTSIYRSLALPIGATWDRRDVKTDATKGFYLQGEAKPFLGFGITDSGIRLKLDARGYKAFGDKKGFVLAARVQGGAILGADLLGTPRDDLFYSGGGGTVRGQPYQSLGVNVLKVGLEDLRTGGTLFLGASVEGRVKVTETIGVVGFVDFGKVGVLDAPGDIGGWHAGAGLGLRYATGVGPIRLDVAFPVGGTTGDGMQVYVGLGQAF